MLRWGLSLLLAAAGAYIAFMLYLNHVERRWTLVDEPLRVTVGRTVTPVFIVPRGITYEIDVYVEAKVPYADCLLGQVSYINGICARHRSVIDVAWALQRRDGRVLRKGLSRGSCCSHTSDEHNNRVVFTTLGELKLTKQTPAYLQLTSRQNLSQLATLAPRVVLSRTSLDAESLSVTELFAYACIVLVAGTGAVMLVVFAVSR
jgi:hypothetical protein